MSSGHYAHDPERFERNPEYPYGRKVPAHVIQRGTPVLVPYLGSGSGADTDLANPTNCPMLIDEITVQAGFLDDQTWRSDTSVSSVTPGISNFNLNVITSPIRTLSARLKVGALYLTRDFVPVLGMSELWDIKADTLCTVFKPRWPIFLKPQKSMTIDFRYGAFPSSAISGSIAKNVTAQVSFTGRAIPGWNPRVDDEVPMPYLSSYISADYAIDVGAASEFSSDNDLGNQTSHDLLVSRIVGRYLHDTYDPDNAVFGPGVPPNGGIGALGVNVRMETNSGLQIVRDPTPFSHLFSAVDKTWWMNTILKKGEFFRAYLDIDTTDGTVFNNNGFASKFRTSMTMHGTRLVSVGDL